MSWIANRNDEYKHILDLERQRHMMKDIKMDMMSMRNAGGFALCGAKIVSSDDADTKVRQPCQEPGCKDAWEKR